MSTTPKHSCVNCTYLQKVHYDEHNEPTGTGVQITEAEREKIKRGQDIELKEGETLRCFLNQWDNDYDTDDLNKQRHLTRKREKCKEEGYFFSFAPHKDVYELNSNQKIGKRNSSSSRTGAGWGWKVAAIVLPIITGLLGLYTSCTEVREWLLSLFE